jgi:hypothetical protein
MNYVLNTTLVLSAYTMPARLGIELGADMANNLGAHGKRHQYLGELACIGLFAKIPNAAKHSHLGQVTPSHTKSRQVTCHLPDGVDHFPVHHRDFRVSEKQKTGHVDLNLCQ